MKQIESNLVFKYLICLAALAPSIGQARLTDGSLIFSRSIRLSEMSSSKDVEAFTSMRRQHAQELLGKLYRNSVVRKNVDRIPSMDKYIFETTQNELKPKFKKYARKVTNAIMNESKKYGFDPIFLMAVIQNESSFNPEVVGSVGEVGLMQVTPQTAEWMSEKYNLPYYGPKSLKDPSINIPLGSAYLAYLRTKFDRNSHLYLAAYNMGAKKLKRKLALQEMPKVYPTRVMQRYVRFYTHVGADRHLAMN